MDDRPHETGPGHWLQYSVVGKLFLLPVLVLLGGGYLLDRWLGVLPGFTVLGGIVGFLLGIRLLLGVERRLVDEERRRHERRPDESSDDEAGSPPRPSR